MSMQVSDTVSYIHTSNNSVNSGGGGGGAPQFNHMSGSGWWSRLTRLEKQLVAVSSILAFVCLILFILVIVFSSRRSC